jgi:antitoxin HicB
MLRYHVKLSKDTNGTILAEVPDVPEAPFATLPALTEAKLALYTAMLAAKVGKAEMARRLNCHLPQIERLLDLRHASRLDQLEAAFRALGKQLSVEIREAA